MISKLKLKSFQAHKSSELEFCNGVNAIIGESDEGKTSIIRALYWAGQNKPAGGDFISSFSKRGECSATIEIDGNEITRLKNKSKNEYRINEQPFKALGKGGIPEEVSSILKMDELNFQNQMDSPFLLSSSSGEVAKYLNNIVNLNVIDESLRKINSKVNDYNKDIASKESDIESNKAELETYKWIDQAEKELNDLESINTEYETKKTDNRILADLLNDIDDLLEELEQFKDRDQELYDICLLIDEYKNYEAQQNHLNSFKDDLNAIKSISDKIDSLPFDKKEIKDIVDLSTLIDSYLDKEKYMWDFNKLMNEIDSTEAVIEVCVESIQTLETGFKNEFPDVCPLCGDLK